MPRISKRNSIIYAFVVLGCLVWGGTVLPLPQGIGGSPGRIAKTYTGLGVSFEPNRGQFDPTYAFAARGAHSLLLLSPDAITLKATESGRADILQIRFQGANPDAPVHGVDKLTGEANYFRGQRENWITHVPIYQKLAVDNLYSGIDLTYYPTADQLEYDFIVQPGGTPDVLELKFDGGSAPVLSAGDVVVSLGNREIRQKQPVAYQEVAGVRRFVPVKYVLRDGDRVGFEIGSYDRQLPLVIDPQLIYSLFLGGFQEAQATAVDSAGNVYICGSSFVDDPNQTDAFVTKINAAGTEVIYRNVFGHERLGRDIANAIAVDATGNAYLSGNATPDVHGLTFPTENPLSQVGGVFVTKFDPSGNMLYSTRLGGSSFNDSASSIAVDSLGNMYVAGYTSSPDFLTYHPLQSSLAGGVDAFVAALNRQGSALIYSTYIGGSGNDFATGLALDANANAYVTGTTSSTDFPTANAINPTGTGAFLFELNPAGSAFQYSTYLAENAGNGVAVDSAGNAYVIGNGDGAPRAFVKKINSGGMGFGYAAYIGGSQSNQGNAIALDSSANAYVTGSTTSADFPQIRSLETFVGSSDAFVARFTNAGNLDYSTLIGAAAILCSPGNTSGSGIASDPNGVVYVTGNTTGYFNFPTTPSSLNGGTPCNRVWGASPFLVKMANDPPQPAPIRQIQSNSAQGSAVPALSVGFPSANQAGNLIIALVRMSTTSQAVSVQDTNGNTYVDAVSQAQAVDGHQTHLFYAKNIAGGANTVTARFSAANNHPWLAVYEYSGLSPTSPLDQTAGAQGSDSSPFTGLIATTRPNELEFAATGLPASYTGTVMPGPGYTLGPQDTSTSRAATETAILSSVNNNYAGRFNLSAATNWSIVTATFSAASPSPLQISTVALPDGQFSSTYTATLAATGGTAPYSWAVVSSNFPPGLGLNSSNGAISGLPTQSGEFTFTVKLTDAASHVSYRFLTINIPAPPQIFIAQLPAAREGTAVGSLSLGFASNNQPGNLILAFVRMSTTTQSVNVTDSAGNPYIDAVSQVQNSDGSQIHLFYAKNIAGGANTVTATFSAVNNHPWLAIYEIAGLSTTNPLDVTSHAQGSGTSPASAISTSTGPEFIFAATGLPASYVGMVTSTKDLQDTGTSRAASESAELNSPGIFSGSFTLSAPANWSVISAAFRQ